MDINNILGNYERIDSNWFGVVDSDPNVAIKLYAPNGWIDSFLKLTEKYSEETNIQKVKVIGGNSRNITRPVKKEKIEQPNPEKDKQYAREVLNFTIDNIIADWKGFELDGAEIPFNKENALKVFDLDKKGASELLFSIVYMAADVKNFSKTSQYLLDEEVNEDIKK